MEISLTCPSCGYESEFMGGVDADTLEMIEGEPVIGSLCVCLSCGAINQFSIGYAVVPVDLTRCTPDILGCAMEIKQSVMIRKIKEMMEGL